MIIHSHFSDRPRFRSPVIFFSASLRRLAPADGLVGFRGITGFIASTTSDRNSSRQACMFRGCSRWTWQVIFKIPSSVMRLAAKAFSRTNVVGLRTWV